MKGAPEVILEGCAALQNGNEIVTLDDAGRKRILLANEEMAGNALRVLAIAYSDLSETDAHGEDVIERNLVFMGLIGMMDPPREEAVEAVKGLSPGGNQAHYDHR